MSKLQQVKQAIANPPPQRLAKIEYQSHFLQMLGILVVCAFLIYNGFWYIIFALIFGVGVSYSQGVTAYQRYLAISAIISNKYDPDQDKSLTRKRDHVIRTVSGKYMWWFSITASVVISYIIISVDTWYQKLAFPFFVIFLHFILYYFVLYWLLKNHYEKGVEIK